MKPRYLAGDLGYFIRYPPLKNNGFTFFRLRNFMKPHYLGCDLGYFIRHPLSKITLQFDFSKPRYLARGFGIQFYFPA